MGGCFSWPSWQPVAPPRHRHRSSSSTLRKSKKKKKNALVSTRSTGMDKQSGSTVERDEFDALLNDSLFDPPMSLLEVKEDVPSLPRIDPPEMDLDSLSWIEDTPLQAIGSLEPSNALEEPILPIDEEQLFGLIMESGTPSLPPPQQPSQQPLPSLSTNKKKRRLNLTEDERKEREREQMRKANAKHYNNMTDEQKKKKRVARIRRAEIVRRANDPTPPVPTAADETAQIRRAEIVRRERVNDPTPPVPIAQEIKQRMIANRLEMSMRCDVCHFVFDSRQIHEQHMASNHVYFGPLNDSVRGCELCRAQGRETWTRNASSYGKKAHLRDSHSSMGNQKYSFSVPTTEFFKRLGRQTPDAPPVVESTRCTTCHFVFSTMAEYNEHMREQDHTFLLGEYRQRPWYSCNVCRRLETFTFGTDVRAMTTHIQTQHKHATGMASNDPVWNTTDFVTWRAQRAEFVKK